MWESIISGSISGVIAGLVVAGALYLIRPKFELRQITPSLAVLHHHGLHAVILGGSYAFERGQVLSTAEGFRAGTGGILLPRFSDTVFRIDIAGAGPLAVGEVVTISYRKAPPFLKYRPKMTRRTYGWDVDPIELYGSPKKEHCGWKTRNLVLHPA